MLELRQSTEVIVPIGPFPDVGDGFTPQTDIALSTADEAELLKHGSTSVVDISGATWAAITDCRGWYGLTLTASLTDTLGILKVIVQDDSDCLPVDREFMVVTQQYWDSKYSSDKLQVDVVEASSGVLSGITSLANWLRGLFRKSAMDSTAKTEVNTGGGTYDEASDSNEAIRDTAPLGTAMRGTDGASTHDDPDPNGYIAKLNITGNVSSSAEVTAIQNNTRVVRAVPGVMERPDSGSTAFVLHIYCYDSQGSMEAPDSAPTIAVENQSGTDRSANLDSGTMTLVDTGHYKSTYTVASDHAIEQLLFQFSVVEGAVTRSYGNTTQVVDTTAVDFTAADRVKLDAIAGDVVNLDGAAMRGTDGAALASVWTLARAGYVDKLNVSGTLAHSDAAGTYKADVSALALQTTLSAVQSAIAALNNLSSAQAQSAASAALVAYDGPTKAEMDAAHALLATAAALATADGVVDSALAILKADKVIDTTQTPWELVLYTQGAAHTAGNEIFRKALKTPAGANVTSTDDIVGQENHTT